MNHYTDDYQAIFNNTSESNRLRKNLNDLFRQTQTSLKLLNNIQSSTPVFYPIYHSQTAAGVLNTLSIQKDNLLAASARLDRWAQALAQLFPELAAAEGLIESPLLPLPDIERIIGMPLEGKAWLKADHALPVAGSIKARGGIYEVLAFAEQVAVSGYLIGADDDLRKLVTPEAKAFFANYHIGVGSTGNLGLSIGVMASALGFQTSVHMSADAKEWKKERLRKRGVEVIEHQGDYASAVHAGRLQMANNPKAHFVDDENSLDLFLGYSVAALRLQKQLADNHIIVDAEHPLFVYLPCGVGGAPGGISWGLKQVFGDAVHCFFAEPTASPAFLVRMLSEEPKSVYDFGLNNQTEADGLAVGQASELVYQLVGSLIDGCYTVDDNELFPIVAALKQVADIQIEPSAAAGFLAPVRMAQMGLNDSAAITHLFWTTGGSFVPQTEYERFYQKGIELTQSK